MFNIKEIVGEFKGVIEEFAKSTKELVKLLEENNKLQREQIDILNSMRNSDSKTLKKFGLG